MIAAVFSAVLIIWGIIAAVNKFSDARALDEGYRFRIDDGVLTRIEVYGDTPVHVVIPDGVTEISYNAFRERKVASVQIPDSVEVIRWYAFADCVDLEEVKLSSGSRLRVIEEYAFAGCEKLGGFTVPSDTVFIYKGCFGKCTALERLEFSELDGWTLFVSREYGEGGNGFLELSESYGGRAVAEIMRSSENAVLSKGGAEE